jgi:hypothetical protein
VLAREDVLATAKHVRDDVVALRRAFATDDNGYAEALEQTALEIQRALRAPTTHGFDLERDLTGWRKGVYASKRSGDPDMRLIFRERPLGKIEIRVFVLRHSIGEDGTHSSAYKIPRVRADEEK